MKKTITYSLLIVIFCSCTTTKSRNDQSKLALFYHNLTSKFNGHFNANELVEEGVFRLDQQYIDNYNELLPIHQYMAVENSDAVKSDMDVAIKKVSVVLKLHEYSDWADDCYLLIGKCEFIKQDYEAAENALEYYMDEFKPNGKRTTLRTAKKKKKPVRSSSKNSNTSLRKKGKTSAKATRASKQAAKERKRYNKQLKKARNKKKKNNSKKKKSKKSSDAPFVADVPAKNVPPKKDVSAPLSTEKDGLEKPTTPEKENLNGQLGHKPAYNAALLWLARTYIERENYIAADYNLIKLEKNGNLTSEVARELPVIRAHYNIRRQNYEGAIERLENAIEMANNRRLKARYAYIIAQLYEKLKNVDKAAESYDRVIAFNPDYEMEFNARLKKMTNGIAGGSISGQEAETKLKRMVKDFKNEEYQDQIYFALAQVALNDKNIPLAIENLVLSVESQGKNPAQKTETNYLLANLYYDQASYVKAKAAFDAALSTMKETDDRYYYTKLLSENLTDIAKNLEIITDKDSLIQIGMLTDKEKEALAREIKKEKDKAASIAEANNLNKFNKGKSGKSLAASGKSGAGLPSARPVNFGATESSFFAFDSKTVKRGEKDFKKTWGDVRLTDNWRISSRVKGNLEDEEVAAAPEEIITDQDVDNIFKNVPTTPEEIESAHGEIRKAMQALGSLYREKLEDYDASSEILEKLLTRYPEAPERLQTYYELYLTYLASGNGVRAEYYKNKIISEFSTSKFAKALSDPDYAKNYMSEKEKLMKYYDDTYKLFDQGDLEGAESRIDEMPSLFGAVNPLSSKFALLDAMLTGKNEGKEPYIDALKELIAKYPKTEEEKKARDILLLLGASTMGKTYGAAGLNEAKFAAEPDKPHFVMVYIKNQNDINMSEAKISISKYNREYHNLDKIRITSVTFNPETKESIILLRSFPDQTKAVDYANGIFRKKAEFLMPGADFVAYPITQGNYREVIKARSVEKYEEFYKNNY